MNDVEYILNDKSKNDKKLIKELSIFINNHKNKNLPINKKFIKNIVNIVINNYEADLDKIDYKQIGKDQGEWDIINDNILYNPDSIINCSKKLKFYVNIQDNRICNYFNIINIIIHELTHAKQFSCDQIKNNEIYYSCLNIIDKYPIKYKDNHDYILVERYAYLRGYTIAYEVLSYIYPIEKIRQFRIIIFQKLLFGYFIDNGEEGITPACRDCYLDDFTKIISPLDKYNEIMEELSLKRINIDSTNNLDLYDRFYLGFNINVSEFYEIFEAYRDIFYNRGSNDNVKEIIKKLTISS